MNFFCYLGFHSQTFTNYRTARKRGRHFFNSSLPLPPASQTLKHQPDDYWRELTSAYRQQPNSNREPLVSERKSLTKSNQMFPMGHVFVVPQLPYIILHKVSRGESVSSTTSKMGLFVTIFNSQKTLTIVIMSSPIVFIMKEVISTELKVVSTTYYTITKILF